MGKKEHIEESRCNRALDTLPVIQARDFDLPRSSIHQTFHSPIAFADKVGEDCRGGSRSR